MHKSIATINSPEFINLQPLDINPLMSECEIKVLYVGENRNRTYISKETATEMAKTLRGAPIVGYWKKDTEDFGDHGQRVIIDDEGIKFECLTVPYGFVAPNARVWFQEFEDTNDFGETILREYLMTTGYLWTGQFEECKSAVEGEGKPHSMELDEETLKGHWSSNQKGMDFFIINDAIFSKLCILGSEVEPCFEGSSVTAPNVSASFTKVDDTFKQTLFSMMQDLESALKGGQHMDNTVVDNGIVVEEPVVEPVVEEPIIVVEEPTVEEPVPTEPTTEPTIDGDPSFAASQEPVVEEPVAEPVVVEPVTESAQEPTIEERYAALEAQHAELQESYSALENQFNELQSNFTALQGAHTELVEFKRQIDDAKKDQMIESFYMLTDEDKQEVVANKANYTVEDIEEKLSVICFRKKVNFDSDNTSKNNNKTEEPVVTFTMTGTGTGSKPAWISAVDNFKNNMN